MAKSKKNKDVIVNQLDEIMNDYEKSITHLTLKIHDDMEINFTVNPNLSFDDYQEVIKNIVDTCIIDDEAYPHLFHFAYASQIVVNLTDISPDISTETMWKLCQHTDIIAQINNIIGDDIYNRTISLFEYKKAKLLQRSKSDDLVDSLTKLVDKITLVAENNPNIDVAGILEAVKTISNHNDKDIANAVLDYEKGKEKIKSKTKKNAK